MSALFSPLTVRGVTLANRIMLSPMCMYSAQDGHIQAFHQVHLGRYALSGVGLLMTEATAIQPEGRISAQDLGIWSDDHIAGLASICQFARAWGARPAIQLAHAGRKASCYAPHLGKGLLPPAQRWPTVAASALAFSPDYPLPAELTVEGIQSIIDDFAQATRRAVQAGFELIEIHAAHGYLLHSFLSPLSNLRTDAYGGSFEQRCRVLLEVAAACRAVMPEHLVLMVRLSAVDWCEGGWTLADTLRLVPLLAQLGVDIFDLSSGGADHSQQIPVAPLYQVPFAQAVQALGYHAVAVGLITRAQQAEQIVQQQQASIVALGRELLRQPQWPQLAAHELGAPLNWPIPYQRAQLR